MSTLERARPLLMFDTIVDKFATEATVAVRFLTLGLSEKVDSKSILLSTKPSSSSSEKASTDLRTSSSMDSESLERTSHLFLSNIYYMLIFNIFSSWFKENFRSLII